MTEPRPISPAEAFALGTLHGILAQAGMIVGYPIDIESRFIDVTGLVPGKETDNSAGGPWFRITVEEVQ